MQSQSRDITKQTTTEIQNPTTTENHNPNIDGKPKSKSREDQSSLDCRLVRAFIAQPIRNTPVPNHLLQRQRLRKPGRENKACLHHRVGPRPAKVVTTFICVYARPLGYENTQKQTL